MAEMSEKKKRYESGATKRKNLECKKQSHEQQVRQMPKLWDMGFSRSTPTTSAGSSSSKARETDSLDKPVDDPAEPSLASSEIESTHDQYEIETSIRTAAVGDPSKSNDAGEWGNVTDTMREYWIQTGPEKCQNHDCDFSKSERRYSTQARNFSKGFLYRKHVCGEELKREWLLYSPSKGGTWRFTEQPEPGQGATMYEDMLANTSVRMWHYSDFPFPRESFEFVEHEAVLEYLHNYCKTFDLMKHIRLNTKVLKVKQSSSYAEDGSWLVTYTTNQHQEVHRFDAVLVAIGNYHHPKLPKTPGLSKYRGKVMHSHDYRLKKVFDSMKRVLIVGRSHSAGDIACAAVRAGVTQVFLSIGGGGTYLANRYEDGKPYDHGFTMRAGAYTLPQLADQSYQQLTDAFDHRKYKLTNARSGKPLQETFMMIPYLSDYLTSGKIKVQPDLVEFTEEGASFSDGSKLEEIDLVIFGTGYGRDWSFLPQDIWPDPVENFNLYKCMVPVELEHHTIGFLGANYIVSEIVVVLELQARWMAAMLSGNLALPSRREMKKDVETRLESFAYLTLNNRPIHHMCFEYEMCGDLNLKPPFWWTLFTSPLELYRWYYGPAFPPLFRLYGRHTWDGARAALHEARTRPINIGPVMRAVLNKEHM